MQCTDITYCKFVTWFLNFSDDGSTPSPKVRVESDNADKDHGESNEKSGTYDEQKPKSKPKFTKPDIMHVNEVKPAGNMLKLKCPAEGRNRNLGKNLKHPIPTQQKR